MDTDKNHEGEGVSLKGTTADETPAGRHGSWPRKIMGSPGESRVLLFLSVHGRSKFSFLHFHELPVNGGNDELACHGGTHSGSTAGLGK